MAAIYAREKNGDNSILVGKGFKMQNNKTKLKYSKHIRKSPIFDIAPYTITWETRASFLFPTMILYN